MNTDPYSVLVVEDSATMRNLVGRIVESDERTSLAGKAMNGRFALQKIESLRPDVIVLSSVATKGARITMEALSLGAEHRTRRSREHGPSGPIDLVAIGVSTGGPNALRKMLALVPGDLPCRIVVEQHMPPGFVYVAPGDHHLTVACSAKGAAVRVDREPPRNGHRPSADVLFASVAAAYGRRAMGVIMTGMGKDGAAELGSILRAGGITIGQDAATSVIYGMPRVAYELGHVERQVPLAEMAQAISRLVREHR